ncbi:hypothetical protein EDD37DRAFT_644263 [Exophiala viscosa]|uniref:Uncharacterized protein n=1 Tax=Exophiala viscosa TaxID=2486360 RepID=A0AAN6I8D4_9EURO|nr:hypothetical protein EDD36DRAFT_449286 [Exophiala viscosa]KAI1628466.1 hypothetical protein EDD37DRAFT_644263 [Exophiala viscosa]
MSSGHDFFNHMRTKLRQSRSNMQLSATPAPRPRTVYWETAPVGYGPGRSSEEMSAQMFNTHLPGNPRPRTTSPAPTSRPKLWVDTSGTIYPNTSQTYNRRPARAVHTPWPPKAIAPKPKIQPHDQDKNMSVEIAVALPPEYLDPPPPYFPPPQPTTNQDYATKAQTYRRMHATRQYDPRQYVAYDPNNTMKHSISSTRQGIVEVPAIALPQAPTPISSINTVDLQYLALRRSNGDVTIDSLLDHPLLRRPG